MSVSKLELLSLLKQLQDSPVRIRFRVSAHDWMAYCNVSGLYDDIVYVRDCDSKTFSGIVLKDIVTFELQETFQDFEPLRHYDVETLNT